MPALRTFRTFAMPPKCLLSTETDTDAFKLLR